MCVCVCEIFELDCKNNQYLRMLQNDVWYPTLHCDCYIVEFNFYLSITIIHG